MTDIEARGRLVTMGASADEDDARALRVAVGWYEELAAYRGVMGQTRAIGASLAAQVKSLLRSLEEP